MPSSSFPIGGLLALSCICLRVVSYSIEDNCSNSPRRSLRLKIELEKNETGHWNPVINEVIDFNDPTKSMKLDLSYASRECGDKVLNGFVASVKDDAESSWKPGLPPDTRELVFAPRKGRDVELLNDGKTAIKSGKTLVHGAVLTMRSLNIDEMFQVKLASGYFHIGVTNLPASQINFMKHMQNQPIGTWTWNILWRRIYHDGAPLGEKYSTEEVENGDTFGVSLKRDGKLHFYRNGEDQGVAAEKVKMPIYGFIDLISYKTNATIVS